MRGTVEERLKARLIIDSNNCWLWQGATYLDGYGKINVKGKTKSVHRVAWKLANGPIPEGMCVCHHCDTPSCVNLKHLFLGTTTDNMRDMVSKGRQVNGNIGKTHCKRGHIFDEENTYSTSNGWRLCRACRRSCATLYYKRKTNG
ncbi:hypothetical protein LCGC14_0208630 [marine sediment metagenome]|uniref:HNH nuclease domain-containing protein n=1 Tax=marine sediment metagenome TaxID=412755 RepID=A0A0F9UXZ8_9ZZZZ